MPPVAAALAKNIEMFLVSDVLEFLEKVLLDGRQPLLVPTNHQFERLSASTMRLASERASERVRSRERTRKKWRETKGDMLIHPHDTAGAPPGKLPLTTGSTFQTRRVLAKSRRWGVPSMSYSVWVFALIAKLKAPLTPLPTAKKNHTSDRSSSISSSSSPAVVRGADPSQEACARAWRLHGSHRAT